MRAPVNAGNYDRKIELHRRAVTTTATGAEETWAAFGSAFWASLKDVGTSEVGASGQVQARIERRFKTRRDSFTATITPQDRIVYGGMTHDVIGIVETQAARFAEIEIRCVARSDQ